MSSYAPPIENIAIFDSVNFKAGDTTLTQSNADKRYLRFPIAQGTENLSIINVDGLATFNDTIKFPDNSIQSNAYTGAGALAGSYTNSNLTLDSNGKITAIANGSGGVVGPDITVNKLTTDTAPNVAAVTTTGIVNPFNIGSYIGTSGSTGVAYGSGFRANSIPCIQFINALGNNSFNVMSNPCLFELTMFLYNSSGTSTGQTCCNILIFPSALRTLWGTGTNTIRYNINNAIDGNSGFGYSSGAYAPFGRQYWTFNQVFSNNGTLPAYGYLSMTNPVSGILELRIILTTFGTMARFSWSLKCLDDGDAAASSIGIKLIETTTV